MDAQDPTNINAPEDKGKPARTRRKPSARTQTPADGGKRSLNLRIDEDTYERLHVHALRRRITVSDLVMDLAKSGCRDYYISRAPGGGSKAGEDS